MIKKIIIFLVITLLTPLSAHSKELAPKIRLKLAKARLMLSTGKEEEALVILNKLQKKYPHEAQISFMSAIAESQVSRSRRAFSFITKARKEDAKDKYISEFYNLLCPNQL